MNVSVIFGGKNFPLHPIDLTVIASTTPAEPIVCINTITYQPEDTANVDFTLGDTFMRNVYTLYDFGSWSKAASPPGKKKGAPFMQLLSVTDADQAWAEFDALNAARIAQFSGQFAPLAPNQTVPTL
ncbi:hypothetical protein EIP91_005881 [Steccherinum ochraceum]|uniref:Peptidase A1 domain-containing protein n=1 Tax=Steccherinum ochraceum TaxID=92696 RepID=A0A4R0R9B5_9APHY|nr:hypothetical protein EIP91_005881 [Steccherinum ochraceum]